MRRHFDAMRRRQPFGLWTISAIALALLASVAGLASPSRAARATVASILPAAERSVDRAQGQPFERDGDAPRLALVRTGVPAVMRIQLSAGSTDGARAHVLDGTSATHALGVSLRTPGAAVEAREDGITSPGQPAPASRAPPIG